jgi:lysophospholipase L1-like esterase
MFVCYGIAKTTLDNSHPEVRWFFLRCYRNPNMGFFSRDRDNRSGSGRRAALGFESLEDKALLSGGSAQLVSAQLVPAIADARGPSSSVPVDSESLSQKVTSRLATYHETLELRSIFRQRDAVDLKLQELEKRYSHELAQRGPSEHVSTAISKALVVEGRLDRRAEALRRQISAEADPGAKPYAFGVEEISNTVLSLQPQHGRFKVEDRQIVTDLARRTATGEDASVESQGESAAQTNEAKPAAKTARPKHSSPLPGVLPAASVALSTITRVGRWQIQVATKSPASNTVLTVTPPAWVGVVNESYPELPEYDATAPGWKKGIILKALRAQEVTVQNLASAQSIAVFAGDARQKMVAGTDYQFDPQFGTIGRLAGGAIAANEPVSVSYAYLPLRIDAIVRQTNGSVVIRQGEPSTSTPQTPALAPGERLLGRIWWRHVVDGITDAQIFPITEAAFPDVTMTAKPPAQTTLTKIWSKLTNGQPITILAWGDSVTDGSFLPNPTADRWQNQFVTRLRQKFPRANITLVTESWPGHNSSDYLNAPRGSAKNFAAHVLAQKPDLVISEFVNDAIYSATQTKTVYATLLRKFQGIHASWIILTPNYTAPEYMNFTSEKSIDRDPRPYVDAVRAFARSKNILVGDAARLWGRLWRQGFPYSSLLINGVNHPNALGMRFYADVLMDLF